MPAKEKLFTRPPAERCSTPIAGMLITLLVVALWPEKAWSTTLGQITCNLYDNLRPFMPFFSAVAYIGGAVLGIKGALLFKKHAENPNDSQIVKGIAHWIAAGALLSLPAAAEMFQASLGLTMTNTGTTGCDPTAPATQAAQLDQMMENFVNNIYQPMISTLSVLCYVIGIFLICRGLVRSSKVGTDPRAASTHGIVVNFVVGAILCTLGGMMDTMLTTVFATASITPFEELINWSNIVGTDSGINTEAADRTVKAILMFVQIVGAIAFIRGWLIVKNAIEGTGQATVPQGITHVIGGTMAFNIGAMLQIFDRTFGTGLINQNV